MVVTFAAKRASTISMGILWNCRNFKLLKCGKMVVEFTGPTYKNSSTSLQPEKSGNWKILRKLDLCSIGQQQSQMSHCSQKSCKVRKCFDMTIEKQNWLQWIALLCPMGCIPGAKCASWSNQNTTDFLQLRFRSSQGSLRTKMRDLEQ